MWSTLQLCAEVGGKTKLVKKNKIRKAKLPHKMDTGCTGQPITRDDVFRFFDEAAGGRKTRAEVVLQTDRLLLHLEQGCTPSLGDDPAVHEKLQSMTWGFLHDGPRSLRGIKLRIAALKAVKEQAGMDRGSISSQLALLDERARVLRAYGNRTASNYNGEWPPGTSDGHVAYPQKRCGGFPSSVRPVSGISIAEDDNGELERLVIKRPNCLLHVPARVAKATACWE
eukprot:COSAG02_NODE_7249_length_3096_cov_5.109073_2_plen_226_part_00